MFLPPVLGSGDRAAGAGQSVNLRIVGNLRIARPLAGPPSVMVDPPWHRGAAVPELCQGRNFRRGGDPDAAPVLPARGWLEPRHRGAGATPSQPISPPGARGGGDSPATGRNVSAPSPGQPPARKLQKTVVRGNFPIPAGSGGITPAPCAETHTVSVISQASTYFTDWQKQRANESQHKSTTRPR
jgi:hypothetical protein